MSYALSLAKFQSYPVVRNRQARARTGHPTPRVPQLYLPLYPPWTLLLRGGISRAIKTVRGRTNVEYAPVAARSASTRLRLNGGKEEERVEKFVLPEGNASIAKTYRVHSKPNSGRGRGWENHRSTFCFARGANLSIARVINLCQERKGSVTRL